ncbi:AraC family transcriptional regulator, arabinose operon regulatory protein [Paenibacillus sophorae]|uniref:AraC family transcriptional regulator n=1 Tax=Paenibacillus sophorae TaxID=1333845 RepID=A0A1H8S6I8_9BACL|nr:AraC family transcriptional regulator [Paenibacillus sophorae]QWU16863.1 AraC family transcriptional regulator [Paenibacillus sophorae]SEO74320.1 AraC family transcriptional regulator, arabinose operon regulatory protein [Paenibacillus sophorae]
MNIRKYWDVFIKEDYFSDFYFFNVGHEICAPLHYGPTIRENYVVHYIVSGEGIFEGNGGKKHLKKGNFFVIRPNEVNFYQADETNPWEYYWLGFNGSRVPELLLCNGINDHDSVGTVSPDNELQKLFERMMKMDLFDMKEKMSVQALFYTIFAHFKIEKNYYLLNSTNIKQKKYSELFLLFVHNNYSRLDLSIQEIAESINLTPAYLSQVIKEEIGVSPVQYLKTHRLQQASILLNTSEKTVYEIAEEVGYSNVDSFSRAFKNEFGVSPTNFQKNKQNLIFY